MCDILNGLQSQAFEINKRLLRFLEKNRQCLVECGLLLPNALARVNPTEASDILRSATSITSKVLRMLVAITYC